FFYRAANTLYSDGTRLDIPHKYFEDDADFFAALKSLPGLDQSSREVLLVVKAPEVALSLRKFRPKIDRYSDDLRLRLTFLSNTELERYTAPQFFGDIQKGLGSYKDQVIEHDQSRGFVRVYRKIEYPNSWEVFAQKAETSLPTDLNSSWVAHCVSSSSPLTSSGKLALCKSHVLVGNVAIHFTVSDENLDQIAEIRAYLRKLFLDWRH
ncbi:hypothetical protein, partial [Sapientia aquatica]|uniref:hypothetical protein n=1 Tax=Sapientia aquatica TaxID=1549640 RepID=UPI00197E3CB3